MTNILQYKCFRSWLLDVTLLDKHLCFCIDVAEGIDMTMNEFGLTYQEEGLAL